MKKNCVIIIGGASILVLLLVALSCAPAGEASPADFYRGQTIDWTVPTSAGGSLDLITRLMVPFFTKYTGANPIVTNRWGAGGGEGYGWVYDAKPDGLSLGSVTTCATLLNDIFEAPGFNYDTEKFSFLFGVDHDRYLFYISPTGPYQSIAALKAGKNLKLAGTSTRGAMGLGSASAAFLLDLDAKVVTGYKFGGVGLALMQNELAGFAVGEAGGSTMVNAGQAKPLFGLYSTRRPSYPDIPAITELISPTGDKKIIVEMWQGLGDTNTFIAPPGVPADRLEYLRQIGDKIMADPEFRAGLDKILDRQITEYFTGKQLQERLSDAIKQSKEYKPTLEKVIEKYIVVL